MSSQPLESRERREFLSGVVKTACGIGLVGLGLGLYSQRASSLPAWALRPPGAVPEDEFDGACIRCGLCVRDCPYDMLHLARLGQSIPTGTPYFIAREAGCGKCEEACILEEAAIKVLPRHLAQGKLGEHYRLGWEQKQQAGGALVTPDTEHRYNLPEGMRYEHGGDGLMQDPSPFPADPLETLNRK
jgi:ferredoxin